MTRKEAINVLQKVEAHGIADEAKKMAIGSLQTVQMVVTCSDCNEWHRGKNRDGSDVYSDEGFCCVHRIITGESYYCGSAERRRLSNNKDEIKNVLVKSLESAKDFELAEAYAQLVSCGDCPYWRKCKNEQYCDVYIADKLKEGE